jgi:hypothetical protein
MVTFSKITTLAAELPEVEESTSYGTPAFKVRGKLIARLKEDNETLAVRVAWEERERLLAVQPEVFFLTEHYREHPWVLVHLAEANVAQAKAFLLHAWQQAAPAALQRSAIASKRGAA